jgi:hypothetical protein
MKRITTLGVCIVLGALVLPLFAGAQTTTSNARVGVLAGSIPPDAKVGVLAGTLPPNATVGNLAGTLPPNATVGNLAGTLPPNGRIGVLTGVIPPGARVGVALGNAPEGATIGNLTPGFAPTTGMGEPLPADKAGALESQAKTLLTDHAFANTEERLKQSEALESQRLGPDSPEMARRLDADAALLRTKGREATASEMEERATAIRKRNEEARRSAPSLAEQIGLR